MKKFAFLVIIGLFVGTSTVGQSSTSTPTSTSRERLREQRREIREELQKRKQEIREEFKGRLKEIREMMKERLGTNREELKKELRKLQDERKKQSVEKINEELARLNDRLLDHFANVLDKLEDVLERIVKRTDKAHQKGRDVAPVHTAIDKAKDAISKSRLAITEQADKVYKISLSGEGTLKADVGKVRQALHEDLKKVRTLVKTAADAVHDAARALAKVPEVDED